MRKEMKQTYEGDAKAKRKAKPSQIYAQKSGSLSGDLKLSVFFVRRTYFIEERCTSLIQTIQRFHASP